MITVRNLTKQFGPEKVILSDINFNVEPGELIALLGASGSGKTTLFRCLTFQEKWDSGHMLYDGQDYFTLGWWGKWKIRKQWAFIEEAPVLNPKQTALKNVLSGRFNQTPLWRKITRSIAMDEHVLAMDFLEKVGLLDKANMQVEKLSGGERQRVAIAKAMVKGARVIVADEPVSGLHPDAAEQVMRDLQHLCKVENVILFCVLHRVELAERYASRIWGLADGSIVFDIKGRRLTQRERDQAF